MPAGIEIYNYVTNQKGSPAIYTDIFANIPAPGFIGRLFISSDTFEIYRDNGITWDLISGGGGPAVNIYNSDGSLTGTRVVTMAGYNLTFEGGAMQARIVMSADNNVPRIFSFRTSGVPRWAFRIDGNETGSNIGGDFALRAYNDAGTLLLTPFNVVRSTGQKNLLANRTMTGGTQVITGIYNITTGNYTNGAFMTGGNPHGAEHNNFTLINNGNLTFDNSIYLAGQSNVLRIQSTATGTVTMQPANGIRSAASQLNQIQYNIPNNGTITTYADAAGLQILGYYRLSNTGALQVNNAYGILINDLNEYQYGTGGTGGALNLVNRYGIFQDGVLDKNIFIGDTAIGNYSSMGEKLTVDGQQNFINSSFALGMPMVGVNIYCNPFSSYFSTDIIEIQNSSGEFWKINKYDNLIPSATYAALGGNVIRDMDEWDGYTIAQIVYALKDLGFLI